jgi:endonuclease/exonuclease/phosphatase family metal-dependent hydrolase
MAAYIDPNRYWQLSFIGFAFPVVLVVNVLFLLVWLIWRKPFGLLPLIAIVLTWRFIQATFAFNFSPESIGTGIKLMTWNVKNFDLYNWSHNRETRSHIMALIRQQNPDIICFQEFYNNNQFFHNVEYLRDTLGYKYYYFPPAVEQVKIPKTQIQKTLWRTGVLNQQWGVATFSKYPITDTGIVTFKKSFANSCIYTDIKLPDGTVRLYNVHFQSIHLGYEDYTTLDELEENQQTNWKGLKSIIRKMKKAYSKRAIQANAVAQHGKSFGGLQAVCGDFNDVPVSYTYCTVSEGLNDAFVEKGKGFGPTFANKLSIFRIDYALFRPDIHIHSYKTIRKELSDHYPVCVTFSLPAGP